MSSRYTVSNITLIQFMKYKVNNMAQQTAKEKAEELWYDYYHRIEHILSEEHSTYAKSMAKYCALIAVNEILNLLKIDLTRDSATDEVVMYASSRILYWEEVKQEIEKL